MNISTIGHSILSASGAHRWMKCTPSALLEQQFPSETSIYADEGTEAHNLAEYKLKKALKMKSKKPLDFNHSNEMDEMTDIYVEYCLELIDKSKEKCNDIQILVEYKLDFGDYVPEGFGTCDLVIVGDETLHIVDLKYGKGIIVLAENNPQMMLYALGALLNFGMLYKIETVSMNIIQPRIDNFSVWDITVEELIKWADKELKPKALLAIAGDGNFCAGEHCRFCRAKNTCRARAVKNLELLKYEFKNPAILSDEEIVEIITISNELSNWASDIYSYAAACAINEGKKWDGFKVVEGRTKRVYIDEVEVAKTAKAAGYTDVFKQSLISITEMEKLMGKKKFVEILGDLVKNPKGKPTLVSEMDKRQPVNLVWTEFQTQDYSNLT